jgi:hypothetical protein
MRMRPVRATPISRAGAGVIVAGIAALALAACGGSSNGGASNSNVGKSSSGGTSTSAAVTTTQVAGTGSRERTTSSAAAGPGKTGGAAVAAAYSLVGGCLLVGGTRTCDLPRSLVRDYREPAVERAIDEFVGCLDKRGTSSKSLSGCRFELVSDVVLRRNRRRPRR